MEKAEVESRRRKQKEKAEEDKSRKRKQKGKRGEGKSKIKSDCISHLLMLRSFWVPSVESSLSYLCEVWAAAMFTPCPYVSLGGLAGEEERSLLLLFKVNEVIVRYRPYLNFNVFTLELGSLP